MLLVRLIPPPPDFRRGVTVMLVKRDERQPIDLRRSFLVSFASRLLPCLLSQCSRTCQEGPSLNAKAAPFQRSRSKGRIRIESASTGGKGGLSRFMTGTGKGLVELHSTICLRVKGLQSAGKASEQLSAIATGSTSDLMFCSRQLIQHEMYSAMAMVMYRLLWPTIVLMLQCHLPG